jgi:hypothetical protein
MRSYHDNFVGRTKNAPLASGSPRGFRLPTALRALRFVRTNASLIRTSDAFMRINASFVLTNASFVRTSHLTRPQSSSPFMSTSASFVLMNDAFMLISATDLFSNA